MKIMEKAKRFFTLNAANHEGFTLVELIVVIAILAILAGVAVPAYSGYIEKSKRAGDETLLAAVNKAFAAACLDAGTEVYMLTSADYGNPNIDIKDDGTVDMDTVSPFKDEFALYFEGNTSAQFQVIESLVFDWGTWMFVDPANAPGGVVTVSYAGKNVTISSTALQALKASSYGSIGSEGLLDQIDYVSDMAKNMAGGSLNAVFNSADFKQSAMAVMKETDPVAFNAKYNAMIDELAAKENISRTDAQAKIDANAAVLYAANNAAGYTDAQISALFADGEATSSTIVDNLIKGTNPATGMADAALVYGMYTAYANSEKYGSDELKANANNASAVLDALTNDADFLKYANSAEGKKDMAAYMDSLNVIVDTADTDAAIVEDLMINGYNNDELKGIFGGLMG